MIRLKMLVALSGASGVLEAGDIAEFEDAEATRLVSARFAVPVDDAFKVAEAVELADAAGASETTVAGAPRRRGKDKG